MDTLELRNVNLSFYNKQILKNFSLKIGSKDKILVVGNSGKGKSTLLKILLGFEVFNSGQYLIDEKIIDESNFSEVRKNFAYVDQDVSLRKMIVKHYLQEISKFNSNNLKGTLDFDLCKYFDFDLALLEKDMQKLSGGERQRLAIIIAIMLKRPMFLLDEITSALDVDLKSKVVTYFSECDEGVISISHDSTWQESDKFMKVII